MIYTVTFNPAIDCVMRASAVRAGHVNRAESQEIYFGGKGVNVSEVLAELGCASTAWGFVAGFTGAALESALRADGIATDFVHLPCGSTRINMKLGIAREGGGPLEETALNARGPEVDADSLAAFFGKLAQVGADDVVVLSGALPVGMPADAYARIMGALAPSGARVVVDATGETLRSVLPYRPFLVKPNDEELAALASCDAHDEAALEAAARDLAAQGARNVLVSRGAAGSFLLDETGNLRAAPAIEGTLVNSVGAGDSMVAGFVAGYLLACAAGAADPYDDAFKLAQACGSATAFAPGLATASDISAVRARLS